MNEQDREFLSAYLDGELDAAEAARAEAMLRDNPQARAFYDSIDRTRSLVQNLSPAKPPRDLAFSVSRSLLRPRGRVIRMPRLGYAIAACFVLTLGVTVFWIGSSNFAPGENAQPGQLADSERPSGLGISDQRVSKTDANRGRERLIQKEDAQSRDVWALTTDIQQFKGGSLNYAESDVVYDLTTSVSADALYSMLVERSSKDQASSMRALAESEKKHAADDATIADALEKTLSDSLKARRTASAKSNENSIEDSMSGGRGELEESAGRAGGSGSASLGDLMDAPAPAEAPAASALRSRPEAVLDEAVSEELEEEAELEMDSAYDEGRSGSSRAAVLDALKSEDAISSSQPVNSDDSNDAYDVFVVYVAESQVDELMREFETIVKEAEAKTFADAKGGTAELRLDRVQEGEHANETIKDEESAKEDMKLRWNGGSDSTSDAVLLRKSPPAPGNALPAEGTSAGASDSDGRSELGGEAEGYGQAGEKTPAVAEAEEAQGQAEKMVKLVIRLRKP